MVCGGEWMVNVQLAPRILNSSLEVSPQLQTPAALPNRKRTFGPPNCPSCCRHAISTTRTDREISTKSLWYKGGGWGVRLPYSGCLQVLWSGAWPLEGARNFLFVKIHPHWPWGPSSFLLNGYRRYPAGVKRPECGVDHPLPYSVDVSTKYIYTFFYIRYQSDVKVT